MQHGRYRQYLIFDLLKDKADPFYQKMLERHRIYEFKKEHEMDDSPEQNHEEDEHAEEEEEEEEDEEESKSIGSSINS